MAPLNLSDMLRSAERNLEDSLRHFEQTTPGLAQEIVDLKLQSCIFHYDICREMVAFCRNKPRGFAASVALKGLVLQVYEYDDLINRHQIQRLLALASARGIPYDRESVRAARSQWKAELARLKRWKDVRNQAAGHYGTDLKKQVSLLKEINEAEVMTVVRAFLSFNMSLVIGLRDAGQGVAGEA